RSRFQPSELQASLAGPISEGLDATVVPEGTAIENYLGDAGRHGPLGQSGTDGLGLFGLVATEPEALAAGLRLGGAGRVVDDLGVDVPGAAEDGQAQAVGRHRAAQVAAGPVGASFFAYECVHAHDVLVLSGPRPCRA